MTPPEPGRLPSADEPLDDADFGVLDDIRGLFESADPAGVDSGTMTRWIATVGPEVCVEVSGSSSSRS